jgi:hypothetical protein
MTLPKKLFYTLAEVAVRWNKTENELLHWAVAGKLKVVFMGKCPFLPFSLEREKELNNFSDGDDVPNSFSQDIMMASADVPLSRHVLFPLLQGQSSIVEFFGFLSFGDSSLCRTALGNTFLLDEPEGPLRAHGSVRNGDPFLGRTVATGKVAWKFEKRILNIADLGVAHNECLGMEIDYPELFADDEKSKQDKSVQTAIDPKTNRPTKTKYDETLTQAVKRLFYHLFENGEVDTLKKANILVFANKMKAFIGKRIAKCDKKDMEISAYLSERIEMVKITGNSFMVKTMECQHPREGSKFKLEKSRSYNKQDVEKRLKRLREENSILD